MELNGFVRNELSHVEVAGVYVSVATVLDRVLSHPHSGLTIHVYDAGSGNGSSES